MPEDYHPTANDLPEAQIADLTASQKTMIGGTVGGLPDHEKFPALTWARRLGGGLPPECATVICTPDHNNKYAITDEFVTCDKKRKNNG